MSAQGRGRPAQKSTGNKSSGSSTKSTKAVGKSADTRPKQVLDECITYNTELCHNLSLSSLIGIYSLETNTSTGSLRYKLLAFVSLFNGFLVILVYFSNYVL